jgi:diadenosine tetraphosphate (Ap4A) HIT family hydrolase
MGRHSSAPAGADDLALDWRADRLGTARRGENPMLLAQMRSGFAVLGDTQHLPGYCVLLSAVDDADHLTDLTRAQRAEFLFDMALLGEAVFAVCNGIDPAFRRINYEVLGNTLHQLHAHVHPRYAWEPAEYRIGPVWRYPAEIREAPEHETDERHDPLREAIVVELNRVMSDAY